MPLSPASRLADFGTGIGTAGAVLKVDNPNKRVGIGTQIPAATLGVAGIVSATAFYGDGSNLDGVASAGLGTALSETEFDPLTVIYQTSDTLSVPSTITVDPPDATSKVAYTQYAEIKLEDGADLIVAEGDDFIPDILGLSTEGAGGGAAYGNNVFNTVYADNIEKADGRGAPNFPKGINVSYIGVSTFTGNVSIAGTLTYEDVTNVDSIGIVTARNGIDITGASAGVNGASNLILKTGGNEKVRITSAGNLSIGIATASTAGLTVYGDGTDTNKPATIYQNALSGYGANNGFYVGSNHNETTSYLWNYEDSNLVLATNNTERLRIGNAGQIGIAGANYGTDGQVLTSKGGSAAVQWADAGGTVDLVTTVDVASNSGTGIDLTGWTSTYHTYAIKISNLRRGGSSFRPAIQFFKDGTINTGGPYMWSVPRGSNYGSGSFQDNASNSVTYIQMCMNENMNTVNAEFEIQNPSLTTYKKSVRGWAVDVGSEWNNGVIGYFYGIDTTSDGEAITGIRILTSDGNTLDAGIIKVYGYK
jgi:hypothetical protein